MVNRRSSKGSIIDFDALRASEESNRPAIGNMGVDGKGNKLGSGGKVVLSKEERVRQYYKDNPTVSQDKQSIKQDIKKAVPDNIDTTGGLAPDVKTAKTQAENIRTAPTPEPQIEAPLGEDFDDNIEQEPLGYREVEDENGNFTMVPYYKEEDAGDGQQS